MADSESFNPYTSSFFKSVKVGLKDASVQNWIDRELHGSFGKGVCRESRKLVKYGGKWLHVPKMIEPTSEHESDVNFYVSQLASGSTIGEVLL